MVVSWVEMRVVGLDIWAASMVEGVFHDCGGGGGATRGFHGIVPW